MKNLLLSLILLLSLTACDDNTSQAEHDAQIAKAERAKVLAEFEAEKRAKQLERQNTPAPTPPKEENKLQKMGIDIQKETITIDTNKTKAFIGDLSQKMNTQIEKISDDFKKGIINTKEAGIEINEKHIHIDINKTKNILVDWSNKIEGFVKEFDEVTKTETNSTK